MRKGVLRRALTAIYSAFLPALGGDAEQARDIAQFVVLVVGTACLAGMGYQLWERSEGREEAMSAA